MRKFLLILPLFFLILGAGCAKKTTSAPEGNLDENNGQMEEPADGPITRVTVSDQVLEFGRVKIDRVDSPLKGWIGIYAESQEGKSPGRLLGYSAIEQGENLNVSVHINTERVSPTLYVVLHQDTGELNTFEFPEADAPLENTTAVSFNLLSNSEGTEAVVEEKMDRSETQKENEQEVEPTPPTETPPTPQPQPQPQPQPTPEPQPEPTPPAAAVKEFSVTAKQWQFVPSTITVKKGDRVKLTLTSVDVAHGFALTAFGVNQRLEPGKTEIVEFVADKSGNFSFFCSVSCGSGHGGMRGQLIVEE